MKNSVLKAFEEFSLLGDYRGATVTVALSGGADSMALLYVLLELKGKLGINVEAAHFNHLIRGDEALRDENFVKEQCKKLGVRLYSGQGDVPHMSQEKGISLETAAREMRYDYLSRINKDFVATAHTASDNLETVIFNLSRGTAIDGLCGIPPKRDIFIRPLILCTREMIEQYCEEKGIPYVTDSTNLSDDYTRNKIRHNVVPVLKSLNPSVEKAVMRTAASLRQDNVFLEKQAADFLKANVNDKGELSVKQFDSLDVAVKSRIIKNFVNSAAGKNILETVHIKAVLHIVEKSGSVSLPQDFTAKCENKLLKVFKGENGEESPVFEVTVTQMTAENFKKELNVNNLLLKNALDCDKIVGKSVVRTRTAGDSIRIKNRGCTKTLKKLYTECHVPENVRDTLPVIADDKGVVWIHGIGVAHRAAVTENSEHILKISVREV